jgi:hypothetical protein
VARAPNFPTVGKPTAICEGALAIHRPMNTGGARSRAGEVGCERLIDALRMQAKRRKIRIAVRSLLWCSFDSSTDLRKFTAQAGPEIAQRHNEDDRYQAIHSSAYSMAVAPTSFLTNDWSSLMNMVPSVVLAGARVPL